MNLKKLLNEESSYWIVWNEEFSAQKEKPKKKTTNRETLARLFLALSLEIEKQDLTFEQSSRRLRSLWKEEVAEEYPNSLPRIIEEDGFLRLYALGMPVNVALLQRIWKRLEGDLAAENEAIFLGWNPPGKGFFDINATPPGVMPKFFPYFRLKKDALLLQRVASDLEKVSHLDDPKERKRLSLALLSHGASYRELEGNALDVPCFTEKGKLIRYSCHQHLIGEGVKTISMRPQKAGHPSIYVCQGTEVWPSQPSVLGSILANLGTHGSATEAYAHSWRLIHKQLRELPNRPLVAGHSMGGALAIQIGLYSHELVEEVFAFNPPMPNDRDYNFYYQLSAKSQGKIYISANLDDFAFWRIGAKVFGNVTVYLPKKRWKYCAVSLRDCLYFFPALIKFLINVRHAFPAHQNIIALYESWVYFRLTETEIEKENIERLNRFDYLHFLPKLYDPVKTLLTYLRKIIKWKFEKEYLRNEIEILTLHEKELLDTLTDENQQEIENELHSLRIQKNALLRKILNGR